MKKNFRVVLTGVVAGLISLVLVQAGNPANMGFCIACFLRDGAGALGLHGAEAVQYLRPEIVGLVLGSLIISLCFREFKPRGGSSPMMRLGIGFLVMVGALMFLGCPLRMVLRIGGGDLNAIGGLVGFAAGIGLGVVVLNRGFSLKRAYPQSAANGALFPVGIAALFALLVFVPSLLKFSQGGPGSMHAPILLSLAGGLIVGALAQRSRFCMAGGIRDTIMFKDFHLLWGSIALLATVLIGNLILGKLHFGFADQPVAHADGLWNFLGMALVGWGSVLLGGCPLRQLVLAGEGDSDSAMAVVGMVLGAAFCHNFGLASSGAGPTLNGQIAVVIGLVVLGLFSWLNAAREGK